MVLSCSWPNEAAYRKLLTVCPPISKHWADGWNWILSFEICPFPFVGAVSACTERRTARLLRMKVITILFLSNFRRTNCHKMQRMTYHRRRMIRSIILRNWFESCTPLQYCSTFVFIMWTRNQSPTPLPSFRKHPTTWIINP